jgi:hypothetical protein
MILMTLLVAKQYKNYYLIPALLLVIPGIYFTVTVYNRCLKIKSNSWLLPVLILSICFLYRYQLKLFFDYHNIRLEQKKQYMALTETEKKFSNQPVLLICNYTGSTYKEYALLWGIVWTGGADQKMHIRYTRTLSSIYPGFYFYNSYDNQFNNWDQAFPYISLLKKYTHVYLDVRDQDVMQSLWTKFDGLNRQSDTKDSIVFTNDTPNEKIHNIIFDAPAFHKITAYFCDAEQTDSSKNFFITHQLKFKEGFTQSSEHSFQGKYAAKLTKEHPRGMTCSLGEVQNGERYKISVWKFKNGNDRSGLNVFVGDRHLFDQFVTNPVETTGNWEKIEYIVTINEQLSNQDVIISCINKDPLLPAYFDNLLIERMIDNQINK